MSTDDAFRAIVNQAFLPAASNSATDDATGAAAEVSSIGSAQN